ncbi:hypothetical protein [Curtobacterium oceanosedimentum]|uniref:hypothetical protein n=1 Tax=Curtobacterium oceanosedimentum TaxID=465820 RepID=UPI00339567BE
MTVRIKNVSGYGDLDVPALRRIVPAGAEVDVADDALAQSLIDGGHFTAATGDGEQPASPQQPDLQPDGQPVGEEQGEAGPENTTPEPGSEQPA